MHHLPPAACPRPSRRLAGWTLALALGPAACGLSSSTSAPDAGVEVPPTPAPTVHGKPETLEIATWNLEHFPLAGEATTTRVTDIVQRLGLDIIAVEELADTSAFKSMASGIPGWTAVVAESYNANDGGLYNPPVGFMYDTASITVLDQSLLFVGEVTPFPRSPLALDGGGPGSRL